MFWIQYTNTVGALVEVQVSPVPSAVEYPDADAVKVTTTQDGRTIIQRPLRDARPRKWMWRNYGKNDAEFVALWNLLESLRARVRAEAGLTATVGIWEGLSGAGGFDRTDGSGNKVYTQVRIVQATRTPSAAGPVFWDATLEFHVDDPSYTNF